MVGYPLTSVRRRFGEQRERAGLEVASPWFGERAVAAVHRHDDLVGMGGLEGDRRGLHAHDRRHVARLAVLDVRDVDVVVLVAVVVLQVEEVAVVPRPAVLEDGALRIPRDRVVVLGADRPDPYLEDVVRIGTQVGQPLSVRRDLGLQPLGVAEEDGAGDQGGRFRLRGGDVAGREDTAGEQREYGVQGQEPPGLHDEPPIPRSIMAPDDFVRKVGRIPPAGGCPSRRRSGTRVYPVTDIGDSPRGCVPLPALPGPARTCLVSRRFRPVVPANSHLAREWIRPWSMTGSESAEKGVA